MQNESAYIRNTSNHGNTSNCGYHGNHETVASAVRDVEKMWAC